MTPAERQLLLMQSDVVIAMSGYAGRYPDNTMVGRLVKARNEVAQEIVGEMRGAGWHEAAIWALYCLAAALIAGAGFFAFPQEAVFVW